MPPDVAFLSGVVPGKGRLEVQRLREGLANETYRVTRGGRHYAVRLGVADPVALGLDRAFEARVLEAAAAADLAPRPLFIDTTRGVLVSAWLEGRNWSVAEARERACMAAAAALARAVHALPIPAAPRVMTPHGWIASYTAALGMGRVEARLHGAALVWLDILRAAPPAAPVLCHSDLHTLNVLVQGHALRLLDWEYAHVSEPLWDVAGWCANNDYPPALRADFLTLYLGRRAHRDERVRIGALSWLYDYICLLWCRVWALRTRGAAAAQVAARAELLHARLHGTLPGQGNGEFDGANDGDRS